LSPRTLTAVFIFCYDTTISDRSLITVQVNYQHYTDALPSVQGSRQLIDMFEPSWWRAIIKPLMIRCWALYEEEELPSPRVMILSAPITALMHEMLQRWQR